MEYYVGILEGNDERWRVRITEVGDCVGNGASPLEALNNAAVSLRQAMERNASAGIKIPLARSLREVLRSGEIAAAETVVLVPLLLDSGRTVRVSVTFDAGLLLAIDQEAARRGVSRSAFLASAARAKIEGTPSKA